MPVPLLIAMILAFGLNLPTVKQPLSGVQVLKRVGEAGCGLLLLAAIAFLLGRWITKRAEREGASSRTARRWFSWASSGMVVLELLVFAWTIWALDWIRVVDWGLRLRNVTVIEEMAVLLPFFLAQLLAWSCLFRAECSIRTKVSREGLIRYLMRKERQSLGMVIPAAVIYVVCRDCLRWSLGESFERPEFQFAGAALIGALIFVISPAFVRLTWPTKKLDDGPLRASLQRLAARLKFRCSEILVWDTGGTIINAGVTGAFPWFRYVLITDAMIDLLDEHEIEAVFGHEVGHIAHRHLPYFGLFFVGSAGALGLLLQGIDQLGVVDRVFSSWNVDPSVGEFVIGIVQLALIGAYILVVFGYLSRRFERQADVYGCRAISCGRPDCPPHPDWNEPESPFVPIQELCPVGIRTFANALAAVARLNGMPNDARSWRHGSIASRIAFLESLEHLPAIEKRFQSSVRRLKWILALVLALASIAAWQWGVGLSGEL